MAKLFIDKKQVQKGFTLDVKRLAIPGVIIEDNCTLCGTPCMAKIDGYDRYLSFPKIGATNTFLMYCEQCDHNWEIHFNFDIKIKLV